MRKNKSRGCAYWVGNQKWLPQWVKAFILRSETERKIKDFTDFFLFCFCYRRKKKIIHACWFKEIEEENESKGKNKWINCYSRRVARSLEKKSKQALW